MKFVLTGAAGNITRPLTEILLAAGHEVTVIGRNAENLKPLTDRGAKAAIGSVEDVRFLTETFRGADAVYTMVPPNFAVQDWKGYIGHVGNVYVEAIRNSGVKYVVNLSSIGAHLEDGCGPVSGLYRVEQFFKSLTDVNVLHLRAGFFFNNFFGNIGMIKGMNIIGGNYGDGAAPMVLVDVQDIADAAAQALQARNFEGQQVHYVVSDVRPAAEIASVLGKAVGKPELPWVPFTDEQTYGGLVQAGLPEEVAKNYAEMGGAIRSGKLQAHFFETAGTPNGKRRLEDFAPVFAGAFAAS